MTDQKRVLSAVKSQHSQHFSTYHFYPFPTLSPWWNFQPPSLSPSHAGGAAPNRWPSTTSGPASFHSLPLPLLANLPAACTAESECRPVQLPARGSRGFPTAWHGAASTHCLTHPPCTQEPTRSQPSTHLVVQKNWKLPKILTDVSVIQCICKWFFFTVDHKNADNDRGVRSWMTQLSVTPKTPMTRASFTTPTPSIQLKEAK